jgi:hypothetical protein
MVASYGNEVLGQMPTLFINLFWWHIMTNPELLRAQKDKNSWLIEIIKFFALQWKYLIYYENRIEAQRIFRKKTRHSSIWAN